MVLSISGEKVEGSYSEDNGVVFGSYKNGILDGFWIEDESSTRCDKALRKRHYWGKVKMTFNKDLKRFESVWGYCDDEPQKTDWTGEKNSSLKADHYLLKSISDIY